MRRGTGTTHSFATCIAALSALCGQAAAFDLQGHRGARGLFPENTLPAFAAALGIGVSTLELDVGVTADGVPVVSHDRRLMPHLARGPEGAWLNRPGPAINNLTLADLQAYDVGRLNPASDQARNYPDQQPVDGARIPTLAAVIALAAKAGNAQVRFNIETKLSPLAPDETQAPEAFAAAIIAVLRAEGVAARSTIQSFDWRALKAVQAQAREMPTGCLTMEQSGFDNIQRGRDGASPWTAGLDVDDYGGSVPRLVKAAGCREWSAFHRDLKPASVSEAKRLRLRVLAWTVNDSPSMERLMNLGVDGIITDYPGRLRRIMEGNGHPLPPPTPVTP
jgi:glycerophosphoryl diester phosphodiesterase